MPEAETLTVNKEKINTTDKYFGYKLDRIEVNGEKVENLPNTVDTETVIDVYYVIDESQTKEISYTVEYYKDGVKVEADIETVKETVQVLAEETLTVKKDGINTTNKYTGYVFEKTEPNAIPDTIANGGVIKVYYEKINVTLSKIAVDSTGKDMPAIYNYKVGEDVRFKLTITNNGNTAIESYTVVDNLPDKLDFKGEQPDGTELSDDGRT